MLYAVIYYDPDLGRQVGVNADGSREENKNAIELLPRHMAEALATTVPGAVVVDERRLFSADYESFRDDDESWTT